MTGAGAELHEIGCRMAVVMSKATELVISSLFVAVAAMAASCFITDPLFGAVAVAISLVSGVFCVLCVRLVYESFCVRRDACSIKDT
jgi:hypothetical protein